MGLWDGFVSIFSPHLWKTDEPDAHAPLKYEPEFGFEEKPRKLKLCNATKEEMDSANLNDASRDYCARLTIEWRGCMRYNAPLYYRCKGLQNELKQCYWDEKMHDMKEFEREKRLNARERILREQAAKG